MALGNTVKLREVPKDQATIPRVESACGETRVMTSGTVKTLGMSPCQPHGAAMDNPQRSPKGFVCVIKKPYMQTTGSVQRLVGGGPPPAKGERGLKV